MKKTLILLIAALLISSSAAATAARAQISPGDAAAKEDLRKTNNEIARLYGQKKYDEALPQAQKAVALTEQIFGKSHLETARALRNLGFIQNARSDERAAENTFEAALDIYKKIPDLDKQNGEAFAELLELLAFIKFQKQADSAEKLYETALIWREKTDGADSLKTARALSGLAAISFQKKEYKKAARFYQRVLDVLTKNSAAGNRAASGDEITLIYYRTECAFRKAEMEQEFEPLKEKYRQQITLKTKSEADKTNGAREPQVVNKGILNGNAVSLPKPVYPDEARKFRAEGVVEVHVIIDERGKVIYACAARSDHFALNAAAETAAYQARFSPTQFEGKPVRVFGRIAYNFRVR